MDLDVWSARPERQRTCRACNWTWLEEDDPGAHTCRSAPTTPRTTIEDRARAANRVLLDRELSIRATRLAQINRGVV